MLLQQQLVDYVVIHHLDNNHKPKRATRLNKKNDIDMGACTPKQVPRQCVLTSFESRQIIISKTKKLANYVSLWRRLRKNISFSGVSFIMRYESVLIVFTYIQGDPYQRQLALSLREVVAFFRWRALCCSPQIYQIDHIQSCQLGTSHVMQTPEILRWTIIADWQGSAPLVKLPHNEFIILVQNLKQRSHCFLGVSPMPNIFCKETSIKRMVPSLRSLSTLNIQRAFVWSSYFLFACLSQAYSSSSQPLFRWHYQGHY